MERKKINSINPRRIVECKNKYLPVLSTDYVASFIRDAKEAGYSPVEIHNEWNKFEKLKEQHVAPPTDDNVDLVGGFLILFKNLSVSQTKRHKIGVLYYAGVEH